MENWMEKVKERLKEYDFTVEEELENSAAPDKISAFA